MWGLCEEDTEGYSSELLSKEFDKNQNGIP